jgi:hypothetical protein
VRYPTVFPFPLNRMQNTLAGLSILLDKLSLLWYRCVPMRKFSTGEAAKMIGLRRPHLQRAMAEGKLKAPPLTRVGGVKVRLWSRQDVERARKALKKRKA